MIFQSSQPRFDLFFSFNFLHPLTESSSLHSSLTKLDGRHKLQYSDGVGAGADVRGDVKTIRFQFAGIGKHDNERVCLLLCV